MGTAKLSAKNTFTPPSCTMRPRFRAFVLSARKTSAMASRVAFVTCAPPLLELTGFGRRVDPSHPFLDLKNTISTIRRRLNCVPGSRYRRTCGNSMQEGNKTCIHEFVAPEMHRIVFIERMRWLWCVLWSPCSPLANFRSCSLRRSSSGNLGKYCARCWRTLTRPNLAARQCH